MHTPSRQRSVAPRARVRINAHSAAGIAPIKLTVGNALAREQQRLPIAMRSRTRSTITWITCHATIARRAWFKVPCP
jgi:hypothetical protein